MYCLSQYPMQKRLLTASFVVLCIIFCSHPARASDSIAMPPSTPDMETALKTHYLLLKKTKAEYFRQRRKLHLVKTGRKYQKAMTLYRQRRHEEALELFYNIQSTMADYKLTNAHIKRLERQIADNRKRKTLNAEKRKARQYLLEYKIAEETGHINVLAEIIEKNAPLYEQSAHGNTDSSAAKINHSIRKIYETLRDEKHKKETALKEMLREQQILKTVNLMTVEADQFHQDIFRLIKENNYDAAQKKLDEFQQAMMNKLESFHAAATPLDQQ